MNKILACQNAPFRKNAFEENTIEHNRGLLYGDEFLLQEPFTI